MTGLKKNLYLTVLIALVLGGAPVYGADIGPRPGQQAPGFELKRLDGADVSLQSLLTQGHVMLVFWEPQCVYCYMHIQDFNDLQARYAGRFTIAAINFLGEHEAIIRQYVTDNNVQYTVLVDRLKNIDVAESYKVLGSPTLVLIAPDGTVLSYGHELPGLEKWLE